MEWKINKRVKEGYGVGVLYKGVQHILEGDWREVDKLSYQLPEYTKI